MDFGPTHKLYDILIVTPSDSSFERVADIMGDDYDYEQLVSSDGLIPYVRSNHDTIGLIYLDMDNSETDPLKLIDEFYGRGYGEFVPLFCFGKNPTEEQKNAVLELGVAEFLDISEERVLADSEKKRLNNYARAFMNSRAISQFKEEMDTLTGAMNLNGLRRRFDDAKELFPDKIFIFIYSDIKNFRYFNSVFGFREGNRLLRVWCDTIRKYNRENDMVCRINADQVVIVKAIDRDEDIDKNFDDVLGEVREQFADNFSDYVINIVSGVYFYDPLLDRGETIDDILGYARQAQLTVKNNEDSACVRFDDKMWERQQRKLTINGHLSTAISSGEIFLNFQPQYNCVTGEIIGAEALCRWVHKKMGFISPGEFIPALEESGKIFELDKFVWESAFKYAKKWDEMGYHLPISVNVSRKDMEHGDLPQMFNDFAEKYGVDHKLINIEITETAFTDNLSDLIELLARFSELGFTVEMDDFGSGFSALNLLHTLNVDVLKLDMGFLREAKDNAKSGNIINAIVKMAHILGINVLAEGVETSTQVDFLKNIGCILMQGYYYSKPIPSDEFEKLLANTAVSDDADDFNDNRLFRLQDMYDRNSSGFFLFNKCIGPAALIEYDGENIVPSITNDEFIKLLGYTGDTAVKDRKNLFFQFSQGSQDILVSMIKSAKATGFAEGELFSRRLNKHIRISMRHIAYLDETEFLYVEIRDITYQKNIEKKNLEIQKDLMAQMEYMPGGTARTKSHGEHKLVYASESLASLYGCKDVEEFMANYPNYSDLIHPDDLKANIDFILSNVGVKTDLSSEHRIRCLDGTVKWVMNNLKITIDDAGEEWCYMTFVDITDSKREKDMNQWYVKKLKAVMDFPGVVLYEYFPEEDKMVLNVTKEGDMTYERVQEKYLETIQSTGWIHPEDTAEFIGAIKETIATGEKITLHVRAICPGGVYKLCRYRFSPLTDYDDRVVRVFGRAELLE